MSFGDNLPHILKTINVANPSPSPRTNILAPPTLILPSNNHTNPPLNTSLNSESSDNMALVPEFDVKNLSIVPDFEGNPNELYNFIHVTTLLLNHYWNRENVDCFQNHMITQGILSKLKGKAKEVTSIYGCKDWPAIKDALIQNFADQRNENSLTRDLVNLRQALTETPQQFYQKVMGLLNTISNFIELHNDNIEIKESKKIFFQQQALTTFLAGLREPLGSTIRAMRPTDLTSAMQYIQEEDNIRYLQKSFGLPQPQIAKTTVQPTMKATASPWQPFSTTRPQPPLQPTFRQPMFSQPITPAFRPAPQPAFRPPPQPTFRPQTHAYFNQPNFSRPRPPSFGQSFNRPTWNNPTGPKPTPMETSTIVSRQPNMRMPQQQPPKFTFEELFNIDQEPQPYNYDGSHYFHDESYTYQHPDVQQNYPEEPQYEEEVEQNFQEAEKTNEET